MKTWNRFFRVSLSTLTAILVTVLCSAGAFAQATTFISSQGFTSNALPSGWSANWGSDNQASGQWFWSSTGQGGSNGSAMDDVWDYDYTAMVTPGVNASAYANTSDSVWVDFDFFWEYNGYDAQYAPTFDRINIDANSDVLIDGNVSNMYTYYNTSDYSWDVAQSSSGYWRHYHILIPIADRTSNMTISWAFMSGQGLSDYAIDNVTITGFFVPPAELSLLPKTLNFGTATPNTPDTFYATVRSVGPADLKITGYSLTGSNSFTQISGPLPGSTITAGSSAQYGFQFQPFTSGALTAQFNLVTNGADSGTQSITLTGVGAVPAVSYGANTLFHKVKTRLGSTSQVQYLTVTSNGIGPLSFLSIYFYGLNANNYSVVRMPQNPLPPGSTDSIGVVFTPTFEGRPDASMVISTTAANQPLDTVSLFAVGTLPHITVTLPDPSSGNTLMFDSVAIGDSVCQTMAINNPGTDTLVLKRQLLTYGDYDFSFYPLAGMDTMIAPGTSKLVNVCFKPLKNGFREASIRFYTNIPLTFTTPKVDTSQLVININGVGVPAGHLELTGPSGNNSVAVGTQKCMTDTIWNTGQADIIVTGWNITGADAAAYSASGFTFPFTLSANSDMTFSVCGTPAKNGDNVATLTVTGTNGPEGTALSASLPLDIFGTTVCTQATFVKNFPATTCLGSTDTATISVTNCGNVTTEFAGSLSGTNMSQFAIVGSAISPSEGAGGIATYTVTYTPDAADATSTASFDIAGGTPGTTLALTGGRGAATIAGSQDAPATDIGATSAPFAVTVNNTGTCPWDPGTPSVAAPFTYVSGAAPIIAGGTGTLMFTFSPTAEGNFSQTVTFTGASQSLPAPNVTITGTANSAGVSLVSAKDGYSIEQNYPNPFSKQSELEITIPTAGLVHLAIIDLTGQVVQNVMNQMESAGSFSVVINANGLASGTYFYQMTSGGITLTRQMSVVK